MSLRKVACAFLASLLMLCGCAGKKVSESGTAAEESGQIKETSLPQETPEPTAREKAEELLASMSLEDKAGQLVNMAVRTWNGESFTAMNDEVRQMFARYHFGGICLFAENITYDNAMTAQLTQGFQLAVTESGGVPMLVSADQEGGSIYRLVSGTATPGNMALAATGDPGNAYKAAEIIGAARGEPDETEADVVFSRLQRQAPGHPAALTDEKFRRQIVDVDLHHAFPGTW